MMTEQHRQQQKPSHPQDPKCTSRRSRKDDQGRDYVCGCGKRYLSYPALYTHIKTKHAGQQPQGTQKTGAGVSVVRKNKQRVDQRVLRDICNLVALQKINTLSLLNQNALGYVNINDRMRKDLLGKQLFEAYINLTKMTTLTYDFRTSLQTSLIMYLLAVGQYTSWSMYLYYCQFAKLFRNCFHQHAQQVYTIIFRQSDPRKNKGINIQQCNLVPIICDYFLRVYIQQQNKSQQVIQLYKSITVQFCAWLYQNNLTIVQTHMNQPKIQLRRDLIPNKQKQKKQYSQNGQLNEQQQQGSMMQSQFENKQQQKNYQSVMSPALQTSQIIQNPPVHNLNNQTNPPIIQMFNNDFQIENLLSSCYLSGNILFHGDTLYSPVLNQVKQMDLANNKTSLLPFQTHNQIRNIAIHPDGLILIAIDMAGYSIVFNLKGMFVIAQFNFKGTVSSANFSQDGKLFNITQAHGFTVYQCPPVWRTFEPFPLIKKYKNRHSSDITTSTITPDSRFLITSGLDNIIYINNLFPIQGYTAITLQVHRYKIIGVSCSFDMKYLYSIDSGSNIFVWKWSDQQSQGYKNMRQSKLRQRENRKNAGKNNQQVQQQIIQEFQDMSQFQKKITSGRYVLAKKLIVTQPGAFLKRYYYDNKTGFLSIAYSNGKFSIFKLIQQQLNNINSLSVGTNKISTITANSSASWIAIGIKQLGQIIVWQWKSHSYILSQRGLVTDTKCIGSFKNSKYLATGNTQGQVKLWQKSSGLSIVTFSQHSGTVTDIKFSNAKTLFSCSIDGLVNAYDATKCKKFRTYKPDNKCQLNCLSIDEAGQIIFAGAFDPYQVYAWNVQTANILQIIRGHQGPVSCLQICGQNLITGSWDKTLKIHQIYSRKLNVQTLQHSSQITALAFHPDGKQFAAATIRGQIYIWEIQQNTLVGIIDAEVTGGRSYFSKISAQNDTNTKYLKTITYSQCGNYLIGAGKSKYIYFYDIQQRMMFHKIQLTRNRDLQGVVQKLNSKFVKQGQTTYQMVLQQQQKGLSDDQDYQKLPGSKKIDISQIRKKLQVDVTKIIVLDSSSIAVCTSFGVFTYSTQTRSKSVFNPHDLDPSLTPLKVCQMIKLKQYSSAISGALSLDMPIRKVLNKIPLSSIQQTISQLGIDKLSIFIDRLSKTDINFRQCQWISVIVDVSDIKLPTNLLLALQNLSQQVNLLQRIQNKLQMSQIMSM